MEQNSAFAGVDQVGKRRSHTHTERKEKDFRGRSPGSSPPTKRPSPNTTLFLALRTMRTPHAIARRRQRTATATGSKQKENGHRTPPTRERQQKTSNTEGKDTRGKGGREGTKKEKKKTQ